jgi:hypothetical protein
VGRDIRGDYPEMPGERPQVIPPGEAGGPQAVKEEQGRAVALVFIVPVFRVEVVLSFEFQVLGFDTELRSKRYFL